VCIFSADERGSSRRGESAQDQFWEAIWNEYRERDGQLSPVEREWVQLESSEQKNSIFELVPESLAFEWRAGGAKNE